MDDVRHIRASATTNAAVYPKYRYLFVFFLYFTLLFREPTPDGVPMREGIPKWPAYTHEKKEFMAINKYWSVKNDYSLVLTSHVRQ